MTDQPTQNQSTQKDTTNRDLAVRTQSLDLALRSSCGLSYTDDGKTIYDYTKIVDAARAFESFIKGEKLEQSFTEVKSNSKSSNPEVKKEKW